MWRYPQGFHKKRRQKYPHRKLPFISPKFPQGYYEEISAEMIPWNSPINPPGNLGDMDGLPLGVKSKHMTGSSKYILVNTLVPQMLVFQMKSEDLGTLNACWCICNLARAISWLSTHNKIYRPASKTLRIPLGIPGDCGCWGRESTQKFGL